MRSAGADGAGGEPTPARDLTKEVLGRVLEGELSLLVTADSATEIAAALRLQREFGFDLVLDSAAESYPLLEEIRAVGVVLVHPAVAPRAQRVVRDRRPARRGRHPVRHPDRPRRLRAEDARAVVEGRHRRRQRARPGPLNRHASTSSPALGAEASRSAARTCRSC